MPTNYIKSCSTRMLSVIPPTRATKPCGATCIGSPSHWFLLGASDPAKEEGKRRPNFWAGPVASASPLSSSRREISNINTLLSSRLSAAFPRRESVCYLIQPVLYLPVWSHSLHRKNLWANKNQNLGSPSITYLLFRSPCNLFRERGNMS